MTAVLESCLEVAEALVAAAVVRAVAASNVSAVDAERRLRRLRGRIVRRAKPWGV